LSCSTPNGNDSRLGKVCVFQDWEANPDLNSLL
jgi:hypothetical protein